MIMVSAMVNPGRVEADCVWALIVLNCRPYVCFGVYLGRYRVELEEVGVGELSH